MKKSILGAMLLSSVSFYANAQRDDEPPATYKVEAVQPINASIYQLAFNTQNNEVYVVGPKGGFRGEEDQFIYVLDGQNLAIKDSINIGKNTPFGIAINNKTQTLYIGHSVQQSVSAVELKTKKQTVIPSGRPKSKIRELVVDEKNNLVYVSDHGDPSIWVIDGKKNKYLKTISEPGTFLLGLNIDVERGKIYATDSETMEGNIMVYDAKTNKLVNKWKTWSYCPLNIAIDYKNNKLFVSQSNDNNITIVDGNTGNIINKIYLGYDASPIGLVYDESKDLIYVANRSKKEVAIVDVAANKVIERVPTKGLPNTIVHDKKSGAIYVTNKAPRQADEAITNGNTVQKITKI